MYVETNECNDDDNINNIILCVVSIALGALSIKQNTTKRHFITLALNAEELISALCIDFI